MGGAVCSRINDIGCGPVGNAQQVHSEGGGANRMLWVGGAGWSHSPFKPSAFWQIQPVSLEFHNSFAAQYHSELISH